MVKTPGEVIDNVISLAKSMLDEKLENTIDLGTAKISQVILQRSHLYERTFQLYLFFQSVEDVIVGDVRARILNLMMELISKSPSQSQLTIVIPLNVSQLLLPHPRVKPTRANVLLMLSLTYCFLLWKATASLLYVKVLRLETRVMSCCLRYHN